MKNFFKSTISNLVFFLIYINIKFVLSERLLMFNKTESIEFSKVFDYEIKLKLFKENFEKINKHGYLIIESIVDVTNQCVNENMVIILIKNYLLCRIVINQ
jgi:hypothetical protein